MAMSFVIACPECKKQIKVSDALVGKKIRCKECEAVFPVRAPKSAAGPAKSPAGKPGAKPAAKPAATKPRPDDDAPIQLQIDASEDDDAGGSQGPVGYVLEATDDHLPRCPFCAKVMESTEAVICIHCGYNTVTRLRGETKKVYEISAGRRFLWLLPGIICLLIVIGLVVLDIFCWLKMKDWAEDSWMQNDDKTWVIRPHAFTLYITVALVAVMLAVGKFAFRRLFINNKPPEDAIEEEKFEED